MVLKDAIRTEQDSATPQSAKDFELLQRHPGDFTLGSQPELLHYAAILLREQNRIEEVLGNRNLNMRELIWTALYPHLQAAGYSLPLRYAPLDIRVSAKRKVSYGRLDKPLDLLHMGILPAVCKQTGRRVVLKITCSRANTPFTLTITPSAFLMSSSDFPYIDGQPRASSMNIMVMPMLQHLAVITCAINGFALHLMRQTFRAIAFLHSMGICHRDIAAGNLMMTAGADTPYQVQLIDFGYARRFDLHEGAISVKWRAGQITPPEVEADPESFYDPFNADIFALAKTWEEKRLTVLPCEAVDLLKRMLSHNPAARPVAADCVRELEQALARVHIRQQYRPTTLFKLQFKMDLKYDHDLGVCARSAWEYARAVSSYVSCRGWKHLH